MTRQEALKLALEALSPDPYRSEWVVALDMDNAITAIKEALAQPEQEPVGEIEKIVMFGGDLKEVSWKNGKMPPAGSILYTTPPQRTWVGLTDEDIGMCLDAGDGSMSKIISFIEAKLKEKNT